MRVLGAFALAEVPTSDSDPYAVRWRAADAAESRRTYWVRSNVTMENLERLLSSDANYIFIEK